MKKFFLTIFFLTPLVLQASQAIDSDGDAVSDYDELEIYKTDPYLADTDGDGWSDWVELNNGFSPHLAQSFKLEDSDIDEDGLSDRMELNFGTGLNNIDSDGDGYSDGLEIDNFYNPLSTSTAKLDKRIEVNISAQELNYFLGGVRMGKMIVSSGQPGMHTPLGHYKIENKHPKAWSSYGLWMPYWMEFAGDGKYGIHELPIWPDGAREGEESLGRPVSHGCIRLGTLDSEYLYNWADKGTPIFIY